MARKAKQKLVVPFGLDARLIRSRYASMLPARKKAFGAEFERFSELQQLRFETAAQSARAAGIKPAPLSRQSVALAKRTVATLKRLQPDTPRHFPPDVPSPVLAGPPYNASVPVDFSSSGEVDFRPWDAGPKAATGQVGGALNTWSGGVGMAKSQVGLFLQVPPPPVPGLHTYEVVVQATLIGNYYLASPPGGYAAASADLTLDFLDEFPEPPFDQPHSVNLISVALLPFLPNPMWDYLNNTNLALPRPPPPQLPNPYSFQQVFQVNLGDPGPVQINVGVTQRVAASAGAIAGIDIEMTVLSIGFAFVS